MSEFGKRLMRLMKGRDLSQSDMAAKLGVSTRSSLRFHAEDTAQGSLWEDRVVLDEAFYAALCTAAISTWIT
jgi:transcriptional regulator with XRE-family HTH domain